MSIRSLLPVHALGGTLWAPRGDHHVRHRHRDRHRRWVHHGCRYALPLSLLAAVTRADAMPPLMPAADVAQADLVGWWREGELLVGVPTAPNRPGMRPLTSLTPMPLPSDLSGWEPVGHTCLDTPRGVASIGDRPVEGVVDDSANHPVVKLIQGERVVAQNALGRPAKICDIRIVEADSLPGLELIIAWRSPGEDDAMRGITVFHVPESLGGTSKKSLGY